MGAGERAVDVCGQAATSGTSGESRPANRDHAAGVRQAAAPL